MAHVIDDPTPLSTARFATLVWMADSAAHEQARTQRPAHGYLSAEAQEVWV